MSKKDTKIEFEEITGAKAVDHKGSSIENLQVFFEKNKNAIFIGLAAVLLIGAGIFYYKTIYQPKAELAANDAMFNAQYYFEQDSFELALNGDGGFLDVIDNHGSTKAGNLASYYAGLCYFNLGKYDEAISHLKDFSTSDEVLGSLSIGVLADAQMEKGDSKAALANYKKAANFSKNEACAPYLLLKAGLAFESTGDKVEANKLFSKLKSEFPNSDMARDIDKYIGRTSN